jgi:hemerythrin superfamily protein
MAKPKSGKSVKSGKSLKNGSSNGGRSKKGSSASSRGSEASSDEKLDALDFLKSQHREVESLFSEFEEADSSREQFELAQTLCAKLTVHATIEEEIFYPAIRKGETKDQVLEAAEEHLSVKRIIADLEELEASDERLEPKVIVLKEQVSHHVDEEEDELFPKVKKILSKEVRQSMGRQLQERAAELQGDREGESDGSTDSSRWRTPERREQSSGATRGSMR